MTARQFKLLNLFSFLLLLGVLYLNFIYEEPDEFTSVAAKNTETAALSKQAQQPTSTLADRTN